MAESKSLFEQIISDCADNKKLVRLATSTAKNFKLTAQTSLEKANELAYWLYIYDYKALALEVCNILETITFTGNYNLWSWVESALALKAHISSETGDNEQARKAVTKIQATYDADDKSLARRLNGDLLRNDDVETAIREKDTRTEKDYRFVNLRELTFIHALDSANGEVDKQIRENIERLR